MAKARKSKSRSISNKRRKGLLSVMIPWLRRFGFLMLLLVTFVWIGAWLWWSGSVHRAADWIHRYTVNHAAEMGITVQNILVEGRVHSDANVIMALTNMQAGDPLFSFDPDPAQEQIEKMEWVKSARVERRLPGTIYIRIEERQPLALIKDGDDLALLDEDGEIITRTGLAAFKDMIIVSGKGAREDAPRFLQMLAAVPEIYERTKAALRMGERRWDIQLGSGIRVSLPEEDTGLALKRLAEAQEQDSILERDIIGIDLREPDRLVIRTRPGAVQEYKASQKPGEGV